MFTFESMNNFTLDKLNITSLNEIQISTAEEIEKKNDVILTAPTGSGKTLAFLLPIIKNLNATIDKTQTLIIVPTRELAVQIEQVFKSLSSQFKVNCCYGGHSTRIEVNNFSNPPAVLIGTPGRIAYHIEKNNFELESINTLVLDEFDKSLEFGFEEDMAYIVRRLNRKIQLVLTSATRLENLPKFLKLEKPVNLDFSQEVDHLPQLRFFSVKTSERDRDNLLVKLLSAKPNESTLVFCNERETIFNLSERLFELDVEHDIFHGKMEQIEREKSLFKFKNGTVNILVTTDLAARGLDIPEIKNIIHYQMPHTEDVFVHRNGRTARMHANGKVYVFLLPEDDESSYLPENIEEIKLNVSTKPILKTEWQTLYLSLGKKDKINKVDIVGLFLQKGKLEKADLGLIEVKDKTSYLAIKKDKLHSTLNLLTDEKIKGKKFKLEVAS